MSTDANRSTVNSDDADVASVASALADARLSGGLSPEYHRAADEALKRIASRLLAAQVPRPVPPTLKEIMNAAEAAIETASDEEVRQSFIDDGEDPDEVAESMRAMMLATVDAHIEHTRAIAAARADERAATERAMVGRLAAYVEQCEADCGEPQWEVAYSCLALSLRQIERGEATLDDGPLGAALKADPQARPPEGPPPSEEDPEAWRAGVRGVDEPDPDVDANGDCTVCEEERSCCECMRCEFCSKVENEENWRVCGDCMPMFQRYWDEERVRAAAPSSEPVERDRCPKCGNSTSPERATWKRDDGTCYNCEQSIESRDPDDDSAWPLPAKNLHWESDVNVGYLIRAKSLLRNPSIWCLGGIGEGRGSLDNLGDDASLFDNIRARNLAARRKEQS